MGGLFGEPFRLFYYGRQLDPFEACTPEADRAFWMKLYHYISTVRAILEHKGTLRYFDPVIHIAAGWAGKTGSGDFPFGLGAFRFGCERNFFTSEITIRNDIWGPSQAGIGHG